MWRSFFSIGLRCAVLLGVLLIAVCQRAEAAIDPYVSRYLDAREPVELAIDADQTRTFTIEDFSEGKRLFEDSCLNCHVGGATLPEPTVTLAIDALKQATPPRDTISSLVAFLRQPMTYDGSEETFWCRQVPESWMSQSEVENLSAFILRAAEKAPGWGEAKF
ncbi:MAG: photosystem II cytochrome PsbV2 [Leptolyngbyaceae cyanobacterium SM1_3_5]|nr:photosystem II cytochrome PsbV2 [Leptolyngbyaceae cyanobacterium SM1_3_5]